MKLEANNCTRAIMFAAGGWGTPTGRPRVSLPLATWDRNLLCSCTINCCSSNVTPPSKASVHAGPTPCGMQDVMLQVCYFHKIPVTWHKSFSGNHTRLGPPTCHVIIGPTYNKVTSYSGTPSSVTAGHHRPHTYACAFSTLSMTPVSAC